MIPRDAYRLRPIAREDLDLLLAWRNAPHIRRWMYTQRPISREEHVAWFERVRTMESARHLIFECAGNPLGVMNFVGIRSDRTEASWGFYLAAAEPPRGMGMKLGVVGLAFAFESLELSKVRAEVLTSNERSLAFHRKLGFRDEEVLVQHAVDDGRCEDVNVLGLVRDHWRLSRERFERSAFGEEGR